MIGVLQGFDTPLILGGDGRCDSPGFSAKYGLYTCMELKHNAILNIELVQVSNFRVIIQLYMQIRAMKLQEA